MEDTYSSWEYSQGPTLYIDSSGFKSIDEEKNFVYFYIVTYSPVEYKRKVTDSLGNSRYEYKYSFGDSNASRKILEEVTFTGKDQVTKTVEHSVVESGFRDTIVKTFYIDTNMQSNIETNSQVVIDPKLTVDGYGYGFESGAGISGNKFGWITKTQTGYRTVSDYYITYEWVYGIVDWEWYGWLVNAGEDYTQYPIYNWYKEPVYHYYTYKQSYTYSQLYNSYCKLNIKKIRDKIGEFENLASVSILMITESDINKAPELSIDTSTSSTSLRTVLSPKNAGAHSAGSYVEYIVPISTLNKFKLYDEVTLILKKGNCNKSTAYFTNACAYLEIESSKIPYINLVVQAYDEPSKKWFNACTIPYLGYKEINDLREKKSQVSKNLFFPSNLPKTDSSYRIQLDTNLASKDIEMLTNFRIDVLSKQLIIPGSIGDRKLYVSNETTKREMELGEINELKLNILGNLTFKTQPAPGFLMKGANDVHTFLRNSPFINKENVDEDHTSYNIWYNYISYKNGDWISNNTFAANSFKIPVLNLLKTSDSNLMDTLITFKVPYSSLKPNSTYTLKFEANVAQAFMITNLYTINPTDVNNLNKSYIYVDGNYDTNKISIEAIDNIFYAPPYKLVNGSSTELVSEFNLCDRDLPMEIIIRTKNIKQDDTGFMTLNINRRAISNLFIKNMYCRCIDSDNIKYVDVVSPYDTEIDESKMNDTAMTVFYDGFHIEKINPLLLSDMLYLREKLNEIRTKYEIPPYEWKEWVDKFDNKDNVLIEPISGHRYGVAEGQPIRAIHFNDVRQCCIDTYEKLLAKQPPIHLNTSPSMFRSIEKVNAGDRLEYVIDKNGNPIDMDKYFPEWRKIIDLINMN